MDKQNIPHFHDNVSCRNDKLDFKNSVLFLEIHLYIIFEYALRAINCRRIESRRNRINRSHQ